MLGRGSPPGRGVRALAAMRTELRCIVAEIKDDTLLPNTVTLEWTYAVYADLGEARAELLDALAAGLSDHRIYEIRLRPVLMALATREE